MTVDLELANWDDLCIAPHLLHVFLRRRVAFRARSYGNGKRGHEYDDPRCFVVATACYPPGQFPLPDPRPRIWLQLQFQHQEVDTHRRGAVSAGSVELGTSCGGSLCQEQGTWYQTSSQLLITYVLELLLLEKF